MRFRYCLALLSLTLALEARAASPAYNLEHALGSDQPLYKYTPDALSSAVSTCASIDAAHAGDYVMIVLRSGRNDADAISPSLVQAAIRGLGANPKGANIDAIVQDAVSVTPTEVLDIVKAAIKASPPGSGAGIVNAAISAVPHPEQMVTTDYKPRGEVTPGNGKDKELAPEQKTETLAEAIVDTALLADSTLSPTMFTGFGGGQPPPPNIPQIVFPPVPPIKPVSP